MLLTLDERGYYDTAFNYVQWLGQSAGCPADLSEQIDYQLGLIHIEAVRKNRMFLNRAEHLRAARTLFTKFLTEHPDNEFVFEANTTLGELLLDDGRNELTRSTMDVTPTTEREPLRLSARNKIESALLYFETADKLAVTAARKILDAGGSPDNNPVPFGRVIAGKMLVNITKLELARTFPQNSGEFKTRMQAAAADFAKLGTKYIEYAAGFDAKLYAAKAYHELGDFKESRVLVSELNVLSGDEFTRIITESLILTIDMNTRDGNFADSIERIKRWDETVPRMYKESRGGQTLYLEAAKMYAAYAESVKGNKAEHSRAIQSAVALLRQIHPQSQNVYRDAQQLLSTIRPSRQTDNGNVSENGTDKPKTFNEALERVADEFGTLMAVRNDMLSATDSARAEIQKSFTEAAARCRDAIDNALRLRDADVPITDVNRLRLQLVSVYNILDMKNEAALLADFLAQRYSGEPDADQTASLAMRLYRSLFVDEMAAYKTNPARDPSAIVEQMNRLANFVMTRWRDRDVASEVTLIRLDTEIESGNYGIVKTLLDAIPADSNAKAVGLLRVGQTYWNKFTRDLRLPENERPAKHELETLLESARNSLEAGLNRKRELISNGEPLDGQTVHAAFALAQICMNLDDKPDEASRWLNDPTLGAMTVIRQPPTDTTLSDLKIDANIKLNVMMLELRVLVSAGNLDAAEQAMNELETIIKNEHGDNDQKLTAVYILLGRQLEEQLHDLRENGEQEQVTKVEKVANGFSMFLQRIRGRDNNTFQTLYWIADTYYRLGSGLLNDSDNNENIKSSTYFKGAAATYKTIIQKIKTDPTWLPMGAENTVNLRLAESLRNIGEREPAEESLRLLNSILTENELRIDVQVETAKTYQTLGKYETAMLYKAITGDKKVWGWNGIIKRTSTNVERFKEIYYDAYENKMQCILKIADKETDKTKREKLLNSANTELNHQKTLRQNQTSEPLQQKLEHTQKKIQQAIGK
jgi:hypothetical protein